MSSSSLTRPIISSLRFENVTRRACVRRVHQRPFAEQASSSRASSSSSGPSAPGSESTNGNGKGKEKEKASKRSGHAQWYADTVPAMIPVALLASAVYLGLQLTQNKLSMEKYLDEANARIKALEKEIDSLQAAQIRNKGCPHCTSPPPSKTSWLWTWK